MYILFETVSRLFQQQKLFFLELEVIIFLNKLKIPDNLLTLEFLSIWKTMTNPIFFQVWFVHDSVCARNLFKCTIKLFGVKNLKFMRSEAFSLENQNQMPFPEKTKKIFFFVRLFIFYTLTFFK